jgi:hypothetical protein
MFFLVPLFTFVIAVAESSSASKFLPTGFAGKWYDSPYVGPGVAFGKGGPFVRVLTSAEIPSGYIPIVITTNSTLIFAKPSVQEEAIVSSFTSFTDNEDLISIFVGEKTSSSIPKVIPTNSSALKRPSSGKIPPAYPALDLFRKKQVMIDVSPDQTSLIIPYYLYERRWGSRCSSSPADDINDPRNRNADIVSSVIGIERFDLNSSVLFDTNRINGVYSACCLYTCNGQCSCKTFSSGRQFLDGQRGTDCSGLSSFDFYPQYNYGMQTGVFSIFSSKNANVLFVTSWMPGSISESICGIYRRLMFPMVFTVSSISLQGQDSTITSNICSGLSCGVVAVREDGLAAIVSESAVDSVDKFISSNVFSCSNAILTCSMSFYDPISKSTTFSRSWTKVIATRNWCSHDCSGTFTPNNCTSPVREPVITEGLCMTPTFQFDALGFLHVSSSSLAGLNSPLSINTTNITVGYKAFVPVRSLPSPPNIPWTPSPPDYTSVITFSGTTISALSYNGTALWVHDAISCEFDPDCPLPCSGTGVPGGCNSRAQGFAVKEVLIAADGTVYALFVCNYFSDCSSLGTNSFIYAIDSSNKNPGSFLWMFTGRGGDTSPIGMLLGPDETLYVTGSALFALIPCPAGYSCDEFSVSSKCAAGSHQPKRGQRSCIPCAAGTFQPLSGQEFCTLCPAGSFSLETGSISRSTCLQCEPGTYSDVSGANSSSACIPCPSGSYSSQYGSQICQSCPPGTWSSSGSSECKSCPDGFYSNIRGLNSSTLCSQCPKGSYGGGGIISSCIPCPSGSYGIENPSHPPSNESTGCAPCNAGSFSSSGSLSCTFCAVGFYTELSRSVSCLACPSGTYGAVPGSSNKSIACQQCPSGTFNELTGQSRIACINCPAGTASSIEGSNSSTSCSSCIPGSFSVAGSSVCVSCNPGTYSPTSNAGVCLPCPRGTYLSSYGGSSLFQCKTCPLGTSTAVSGTIYESDCVAGTFSCPLGMQPIYKNGPSSIKDCVPLVCPYPLQPSSIDGSIVSQPSLGLKCRGCARGSFGSYSTSCSVCESGEVCPGLLGVPLPNGSSLYILSQSPLSTTWLCPGGTLESTSPIQQQPQTSSTIVDAGSIAVLGIGIGIILISFLSLFILMYSPKKPLMSTNSIKESNIRIYARRYLEILDSFSLSHDIKEGESVAKKSTALGGAFTVAGACTLAVLSAILAIRRQTDNTLIQQSLSVLDAPTLIESKTKPWTLISVLSARWGRPSSSSSSTEDVLPSLIRIRAIVAGDSDSSCGSLSSSNWTVSGLDIGRFTFHKELSQQPCASGVRKTTSTRGQASVFQLQWTCTNCLLSPQTRLTFQLPFSCQSIALEVSAAAAGGSISVLRGNSDENIESGGLLTDFEWNVLPLLDELYDLRPAATQTAKKGYTLIDGGIVLKRSSADDGSFGLITPSSSYISLVVHLPLQPYFSRTTLSEKTSLLDLFASIVGLDGLFSVFGMFFQLAEKRANPSLSSSASLTKIETATERQGQRVASSTPHRKSISISQIPDAQSEEQLIESKNPIFNSDASARKTDDQILKSNTTNQWIECNQDGVVYYVSPTGQSYWELPEGITAIKESAERSN